MKNFDCFINTVNREYISDRAMSEAIEFVENCNEVKDDSEDKQLALSQSYTRLYCDNLLREYHIWLMNQLNDNK